MTNENDDPEAHRPASEGAAPPEGPAGPEIEADTHRPLLTVGWALAEIGIVTVGILLAFVLEAWWQERALAQRERVHLEALASDFEQNVASLERLVELEERIVSSSDELLDLAANPEDREPGTVADLMRNVFSSARYEPVMGAYEALVNSGGLTLISDDDLRGALARFAARVSDRYGENWSNELYLSFTREFGGRIVIALDETNSFDHEQGILNALLDDPDFRGHLLLRLHGERNMAGRYRDLLDQAETIRSLVREQLPQ